MMGRRAHRCLAATLLVLSLGGCSTLRGGKLWAPEAFGFVPVATNLYIEAGADEATRAQHIPMPSRAELITFKTLSQWLAVGQRYSDGKNAERRARGEPEIHALYASAGHEVRPWFAQVGTAGLLKLIAELNTGAEFSAVYTNR